MVEYSSPRGADEETSLTRHESDAGSSPHDYRDDDRRPKADFEAAVAPEPVGRIEQPAESVDPPKASEPQPVAAVAQAAAKPKRSWKRPILFVLLPIGLVAGGYYYVVGGQVMSTDNAYVQAQTIGLSTDVSGTVFEIDVHNNEAVKKGQILFRLRPDSFRIALEGAQAQLGTVRNQVLTLQATYKQSLAQIEQAKADLPYYETTFKRQKDLVASAAASKSIFDQAEHDLISARERLIVSQAQAQSMLAQLGGDADQSVEQNPFYLQAKSLVDNAQRDLNDTIVRAPFDGVVTRVDSLQVGAYLPASQQGFMLVSDSNLWVEASPKETELTWVRPGQAATVTVDTYPGVEWSATVDSINPASGGSFALLPAQNTTGNWVKVVQRIPMRVHIDSLDGKPPLRVGMSVVVEIDTGHPRGVPESLKPIVARLAPYVEQVKRFAAEHLHTRV
ncbi:HlyD family secretion protein [Lichenifustis flavocetrariae]|uniref:HlyD family secretion protein n=1 Tax=Lichenifustis flavocetrariae TaxID=2949735 RepID=A0AA41YYH8_9HYPH|nr:HlyD family secretion protein [Lichenifustis flavocetrariae]MCW6507223.1 HlyD family secretion protein [Lichenifustis flavocetrariae]